MYRNCKALGIALPRVSTLLRSLPCQRNLSQGLRWTGQRQFAISAASYTTVSESEVTKFSRLSQHWWNETGEFAALHTLNGLRVPFIVDSMTGQLSSLSPLPLKGFRVLDVGCGGGILCEALARLGADVTGIDASSVNIDVATQHSLVDPLIAGRIQYLCCPVENLKGHDVIEYDAVVMSEIVEHVIDPESFISAACSHVKIGGSVFITTINRTTLSYLLVVIAAEQLLRIVPRGSHDWAKFVAPQEVQQMLSTNSVKTRLVHGMTLNPINLKWSWCPDRSCNYTLHAVKVKQEDAM